MPAPPRYSPRPPSGAEDEGPRVAGSPARSGADRPPPLLTCLRLVSQCNDSRKQCHKVMQILIAHAGRHGVGGAGMNSAVLRCVGQPRPSSAQRDHDCEGSTNVTTIQHSNLATGESSIHAIVFDCPSRVNTALIEALDAVDVDSVFDTCDLEVLERHLAGAETAECTLVFISAKCLGGCGMRGLEVASSVINSAGRQIVPVLTLLPEELAQVAMLTDLTGVERAIVSSDVAWDIVPQLLDKAGDVLLRSEDPSDAPVETAAAEESRVDAVGPTDDEVPYGAWAEVPTESEPVVAAIRPRRELPSQRPDAKTVPTVRGLASSSGHDQSTAASVRLRPVRSKSTGPRTPRQVRTPVGRMARRSLGGEAGRSVEARTAFNRGQGLLHAGQIAEAHGAFTRAAELAPSMPVFVAHSLWSGCLVDPSKRAAATEGFGTMRLASDHQARLWGTLMLARLHRADGQLDRALALFKEVLRDEPNHSEAAREVREISAQAAVPDSAGIFKRLLRRDKNNG